MVQKLGKVTALDVYNGVEVGEPIFVSKPYLIISNEGVVLSAGTLDHIKELHDSFAGYYDNCEVQVRRRGLYMNDNTLIGDSRIPSCNNRIEYYCNDCPFYVKDALHTVVGKCTLGDYR